MPQCPDLTFFPYGENLLRKDDARIKKIMAPYCNVNSVQVGTSFYQISQKIHMNENSNYKM